MRAMADSPKPRLLPLLFIAGTLTLVVTAVRCYGEVAGWDPRWFSAEPGSPLNPFGIVWLVPVFGFLFGRRAAQTGGRPPFVASFFVPMFALCVLLFAGGYIGEKMDGPAMREAMQYVFWGAPVLSLLALFSWPRMYLIMLVYGLWARLPVMAVQYLDIQNGWQTHYGKVHPKLPSMSADDRLWLLTLAQGGFWIPFTILLGSGFAAIGAVTVRKA